MEHVMLPRRSVKGDYLHENQTTIILSSILIIKTGQPIKCNR